MALNAFNGKITITGVKELDTELALIAESDDGPKSVNNAMRRFLREAVRTIVLPKVKELVPVAQAGHWRSGTGTTERGGTREWSEGGFLESQITVRARRRSRTSVGFWCGFPDELFKGETYYGAWIEFGTKDRKTKSGKSTGRVEADSYLRRALYPNATAIVDFVRRRTAEWIAERNQTT
jgi:hypothetical protein